ncbi:hypothetical protein [Mucilaginibacter paludis]|nr:hypothetical protein [Mucilaginibacter paludis]
MKNTEVIPDLKGRKFNGHVSKIKRIRTEQMFWQDHDMEAL